MKSLLSFISDHVVQVSAINAGIMLSALDWSIKIALGLPSAVYVCFKIYYEFLTYKNEKHENSDPE